MGIRAVVFDVDGTLYPSFKMYFRSIGFFLQHPLLLIKFNNVRKRIRAIRPITNFKHLQAELLAEEMGIPVEQAAVIIDTIMYQKWENIFKGIRTFPHVQPVLNELKRRNLMLGVLSDFPVLTKLAYMNLEGLWDCALASEEAGYLKPNPEPFLLASRQLNVDPSEILFVGNSYEYDIVGAKKVGMKAALFTRGRWHNGKADVVFSSYKNFIGDIEEII